MIWIVLKYGLIAFAVWFLNGLRKVIFNQRIKLVSFDKFTLKSKSDGNLSCIKAVVKRQTYFPPFAVLEEEYIYDSNRTNKDYDYWDLWTSKSGRILTMEETNSLQSQIRFKEVDNAHTEKVLNDDKS